MKIYSSAPDGNEAADVEPARYFNLAKEQIEESMGYMKTIDKPVQVMLVHIDILLHLSKKYPGMATRAIKLSQVAVWKTAFFEWYERFQSKIPAKFREGIKASAEGLFSELEAIGH